MLKTKKVLYKGDVFLSTVPVSPPRDSQVSLTFKYGAIHHLVRARAMGKHYSNSSSSTNDSALPVGVDGVGQLEDGRWAYFTTFQPGKGSFQQLLNVEKEDVFWLPFTNDINDADKDGVLRKVAVLANSAMASYLALGAKQYSYLNRDGFNVLINGVTGGAGSAAVEILKNVFKANKVIGISRSKPVTMISSTLSELDELISLNEVSDEELVRSLTKHRIDLVLDFTWGQQALRILQTLAKSRDVRKESHSFLNWVQIGQVGGPELSLPAGILRSHNVNLTGSGLGSVAPEAAREMLQLMVNDIATGKIGRNCEVEIGYFDDIIEEWRTWDPSNRKAYTFEPK